VIAIDTNILIYAHRAETALHATASSLLVELAEGDGVWALPVFCIAEFVRVVTHPRVFNPPSQLAVALDFVDHLLGAPTARLILASEKYPALFREACEAGAARGNLAFDAQIAAVCREHGVSELVTADRDFARFPALRTRILRT
jgi:uncharacterized protein